MKAGPADEGTFQKERKEMARGASLAFLGRFGAIIEAASFPLFLWLYGSVTFGLFATLWAIVRMATAVTQMGMDIALQRFLPSYDSEDKVHRGLAVALAVTFGAGLLGAFLMVFLAPWIARFVDGEGGNTAQTVSIIRLYAWCLPLWTLVEVLTASVRARRRFGPEIRIRFFYEQLLRIVIAAGLALAGFTVYGLFIAHVASMAIATVLSVLLVMRFYELKRLVRAGFDPDIAKEMIFYALPMMPATLIQRFFSELPVVLLNILIPGNPGTIAAGYYTIARKISSVMQVIHNSFDYVIAPLAAFQSGHGARAAIADMYAYSTRLMIALGILLAAGVLGIRHALVGGFGPEARPAMTALLILVLGRLITFFFGQAPAIIRTLSSTWWTLANGLAGLAVMVGLLALLVGQYGAVGAAVAASVGLVVTRGLALVEVAYLNRMWPYSRAMVRPLFVSLLGAIALFGLGEVVRPMPVAVQIFLLVLVFAMCFLALLRYGLSSEDAVALGGVARFARRKWWGHPGAIKSVPSGENARQDSGGTDES